MCNKRSVGVIGFYRNYPRVVQGFQRSVNKLAPSCSSSQFVSMDAGSLVTALGHTLDPNLRQEAEKLLEGASKHPGFTPLLLQITLENSYATPLRQAAALYLKNTIVKYWKEGETNELVEGVETPFSLDEQSKAVIRDNIIGAIIQCPLILGRQLCVCLEKIIRHDFPEKWTGVVTSIHTYLTSDNQATWLGSLLALEQLAKKYKFKKKDERQPYIQAMQTLLPILYQHMMAILPNHTIPSVTLQHHILKIFYASMQYTLSLEIMNDTTLPGWMIVLQTIVQRPVPEEAMEVDEDDRPELEWWKCKKWALHILERFVYRYGNPANAEKEYSRFAQYYSKTFNGGVINVLMKQLNVKRQGGYVAPRVVQGIFNYLLEVVDHANSWKLIKDHFMNIFHSIIFPMMCYSEEDNQLWEDDPYEYIRMKFDIFEDLVSPTVAAIHFLARACAKRKGTLDPVMETCVGILNTPPEQRDPSKKDGALHVIGQVAETLLKRKKYSSQLESMLVAHVFPEFTSSLGYMRARACWMIHYFSEITFKNQTNLQHALERVFNCLTADKELPVKVEAAVALQYLIKNQSAAESFIQPHVRPIIKELLVVIKETENDDLTNVMQELIETYADQMGDVAVNLCQELVSTFNDIVDPNGQTTDEDSYKALTALGILSAIQALVKATFNQTQIMVQMEKTLIQMMATILRNGVLDFYEEMFALIDLFTTVGISAEMWQMLGIIYETFSRDGYDYFTEIMSVLYNFVKVDTPTFLSNPHNLEAIIEMCKSVMSGDPGEDPQVHACKLLEVVILQCHGKIDSYIPGIMGIVLERLTQQSKTTELKNMCMLVVIAGLHYNAAMMLELLENTRFPDSTESVTAQLFKQWIKDAELFVGVHDRKMSIFGLCAVLHCLLHSPARLPALVEMAPSFIPTIVTQLEALVEAYKDIAGAADDGEGDDDEEEDDMEEQEEKELESDEDEADEESQQYLEHLAKRATKGLGGDDLLSASDDDIVQTLMELDYETCIDDEDQDEFANFKTSLEAISSSDPQFYSYLVSTLPPDFSTRLQAVFQYADQRQAVRESKAIEVAGGYKFNVTSVPNSFVFKSP